MAPSEYILTVIIHMMVSIKHV